MKLHYQLDGLIGGTHMPNLSTYVTYPGT